MAGSRMVNWRRLNEMARSSAFESEVPNAAREAPSRINLATSTDGSELRSTTSSTGCKSLPDAVCSNKRGEAMLAGSSRDSHETGRAGEDQGLSSASENVLTSVQPT